MRKLDTFADERFGGDTRAALAYLSVSKSGDVLDDYLDELTSEESAYVYQLMRQRAIRNYGGEENYRKVLEFQQQLARLDMTEEEFRAAQVNPYKMRLAKRLAYLAGLAALTVLLYFLDHELRLLPLIFSSILTVLFAINAVSDAVRFFVFRKAKILQKKLPTPREAE